MSKKSRALAKRPPVALAVIPATAAAPEVGRLVLPRPSSSRAGRSIQQVTPSRVGSVLRDLDGGRYEQWADLIQQASRDPIVHRVDYIRRAAVAARPYTVRAPDDVAPGMQSLAEEAVKLTKTWLASIPAREMWLMRVLGAINAGIAVDELVYYRSQGLTLSRPEPVYTRDVRLNPIDDAVEVRTASLEWIRVADHPGKFLVHVPYTRPGRAQDQGEFQAGVWYWCFKGKAIMFWLLGAERFANPLVFAKMMADASKSQREAMLADLQQLTSDSVGVLVGATDVQTLSANATGASQVWETLTKKFDDQIALAGGVSPDLLMSGVNGSRASDTLRDGVRCEGSKLDSVLMWGSIVRDCVAPLIAYNLRRNDVPLPIIESVFDDAVAVRPETIATGKVRVNEARAGNGLPALSDEDGGNDFIPAPQTAAAPAPVFSDVPASPATPAPGSAPAASPFPISPLSAGGMPTL